MSKYRDILQAELEAVEALEFELTDGIYPTVKRKPYQSVGALARHDNLHYPLGSPIWRKAGWKALLPKPCANCTNASRRYIMPSMRNLPLFPKRSMRKSQTKPMQTEKCGWRIPPV